MFRCCMQLISASGISLVKPAFHYRHILPIHSIPRFLSESNGSPDKDPKGKVPIVLNDEDLEESFICGWGPGGQAINKTANCVRLTHIPTGITVKCQDGRNLHANRHIARKRLMEHLDAHFNGEESAAMRKRREEQARENNRYSRAKRRLEMKAAFKQKCLSERNDDERK